MPRRRVSSTSSEIMGRKRRSLEALTPEVVPGVHLFPVVHDRLDLTSVVRAVLDELQPAGVAVELPIGLTELVLRAVRRLPKVSLVLSERAGEDALVWVSIVGDPFAEAMRWAGEFGKPVFFVDPDIPYEHKRRDPVPDPYAVWSLGPQKFLDLLVEQGDSAPRSDTDRQREAGIAHRIKEARGVCPSGPLLALLGAAHVRPVTRRSGKQPPSPSRASSGARRSCVIFIRTASPQYCPIHRSRIPCSSSSDRATPRKKSTWSPRFPVRCLGSSTASA